MTGVFESLLHLDGGPHLDHNLLHGTCNGHHYRHIIIKIFLILLLVIVTWSGHFAEQVCHHLRMAKMAIVRLTNLVGVSSLGKHQYLKTKTSCGLGGQPPHPVPLLQT